MSKKPPIKYGRSAISLLRKGDFDGALIYLSLSYENSTGDKELILSLIELCDSAKSAPKDAIELINIYLQSSISVRAVREVISMLDAPMAEFSARIDGEDAISYKDFCKIEREQSFKKAFEAIIFSTRIIISEPSELVGLVLKLLETGFTQIGLNYLEAAAPLFSGNQEVENLLNRLRDENRLK